MAKVFDRRFISASKLADAVPEMTKLLDGDHRKQLDVIGDHLQSEFTQRHAKRLGMTIVHPVAFINITDGNLETELMFECIGGDCLSIDEANGKDQPPTMDEIRQACEAARHGKPPQDPKYEGYEGPAIRDIVIGVF